MAIIVEEISNERIGQDKRWGQEADDTKNDPFVWMAIIAKVSSSWMVGQVSPFPSDTVDGFRNAMIKTAAVAQAAVESIDRQRAANGTTFFEMKSDFKDNQELVEQKDILVAHDFVKEIALAINRLYADTSPESHDRIDTLRDDIATSLANAGYGSTSAFNDIARTKRG